MEEEIEKLPDPIIKIETTDQLEELLDENPNKKIFLLKNSTQCPISATAKQEFETFVVKHEDKNLIFCRVDVIEYREVSNRIEELLKVKHESPQLLVIKNSKLLFHTSHDDVTMERLEEQLEK